MNYVLADIEVRVASDVYQYAVLGGHCLWVCTQKGALRRDSHGTKLQEVLVTAQCREEALQQTPIVVTAIDAAGLRQNNVNTIASTTARPESDNRPPMTITHVGGCASPPRHATLLLLTASTDVPLERIR
jgi:hypothetical protein